MDHLLEAAGASLEGRQTVEGWPWEDSDFTLGDSGKLEIGTCPQDVISDLGAPETCPSPPQESSGSFPCEPRHVAGSAGMRGR